MNWSCGLCSQSQLIQGAYKVHIFAAFYTFYPVGFPFMLLLSKKSEDLNMTPAMWAAYPSA